MTRHPEDDLIFDVGAHKGEDSDYYLKLGYRVVAIEANPQLADHLRKRFSEQLGTGQYTVVEKAISDVDGILTFYVNEDVSVWGTADPKWAQRNKEIGTTSREIKVQGARFSDLLKTYGCPCYLKIDVEGADMLCVRALHDSSCRPKYVSIESTKTSWSELLDEFETFDKLGYTRFAIVNQLKHKNGSFKTRGGDTISYTFEEGSTGPFGKQLQSSWCSKQEAIRKYTAIFLLYKILGDNAFLTRIIKRIPVARRILGIVSWYDTHAMIE